MCSTPQWMGDFVDARLPGGPDARIAADPSIQWDDVAPFFRDFSATYNGKTYTIPLDGDFHMAYYRTDLLEEAGMEPPKTWDDYLAIAETFNGKDLNGDGKADYGSCIAKKRNAQSYWFITSIAGTSSRRKGTGQGAFFDTDDDEAAGQQRRLSQALQIYIEDRPSTARPTRSTPTSATPAACSPPVAAR